MESIGNWKVKSCEEFAYWTQNLSQLDIRKTDKGFRLRSTHDYTLRNKVVCGKMIDSRTLIGYYDSMDSAYKVAIEIMKANPNGMPFN